MDPVETLFFIELIGGSVMGILASREAIYFHRLRRSRENQPPSWLLEALALSIWAITAASAYFAAIAAVRILITDPGEVLRPLPLLSMAVVIVILSIPVYLGREFRRRRIRVE